MKRLGVNTQQQRLSIHAIIIIQEDKLILFVNSLCRLQGLLRYVHAPTSRRSTFQRTVKLNKCCNYVVSFNRIIEYNVKLKVAINISALLKSMEFQLVTNSDIHVVCVYEQNKTNLPAQDPTATRFFHRHFYCPYSVGLTVSNLQNHIKVFLQTSTQCGPI